MEITYSIEQLNDTAKKILDFLNEHPDYRVVAMDGKMGSGKTTLIKELCNLFGVQDEVTSPTFAIINEYKTDTDDFVYHFDFYRLENIQEAIDIGTEDYFYSGFYCFLEWADIVEPILPNNTLWIKIEEVDKTNRKLSILNKN